MKKINNKGFTLVELLAAMAIMSILLGLAIGTYTAIVLDSQKSAFVAEAMVHVKGIRHFIENEDIDIEDDNTVYYFNYRLGVDNSVSPFEEWEDCYVVVTYNPESDKNTYYWTGLDKDKWGIKLHKEISLITKDDVEHKKMTTITAGNSIGGRDNVVIYNASDTGDPEDYTEEARLASNEMTYEEAEPCFTLKRLDDGTYEISDYRKSCGPVVDVPSMIDGKPVTYIGENAFRDKGITSITIYHGIKELKYGAFQQNPNLKEIKIASTVKKIGDYAFYNGKLEKVIFPEGLEEIGQYSFAYNNISSVHFSSTLKKIGYRAFLSNKLENVEFNSSVSVGGGAFSNNQLSPEAGFIYGFKADGTPDYSKLIGYGGESKDVVIPASKNGVALKTIAGSAFSDANINSVVIPSTVTEIGSSAFYNNNLKTVTFPAGLKTIGASAFRDNYLSTINIPSSVTSIGSGAFTDNCVPLNSAASFIYKVGDKSTIVSGASGKASGCSGTTSGVLKIPAKNGTTALKRVVSSAFIGGKYTGLELPSKTAAPNLTLEPNFIVHNSPGNAVGEDTGYIYAYNNGTYDYSTIIAYMGKRPPNTDGVYTFPAKKNDVELKTIKSSLTWAGVKKIIIPSSVTTISGGIFNKTNNANPGLVTIVNKTGRDFDWYALTGSNRTSPGAFDTGVVQHQSGNIEIVAK